MLQQHGMSLDLSTAASLSGSCFTAAVEVGADPDLKRRRAPPELALL